MALHARSRPGASARRAGRTDGRQAVDKAVDNCPDPVDAVWVLGGHRVDDKAPFISYMKGACWQCAALGRGGPAGAPASAVAVTVPALLPLPFPAAAPGPRGRSAGTT